MADVLSQTEVESLLKDLPEAEEIRPPEKSSEYLENPRHEKRILEDAPLGKLVETREFDITS